MAGTERIGERRSVCSGSAPAPSLPCGMPPKQILPVPQTAAQPGYPVQVHELTMLRGMRLHQPAVQSGHPLLDHGRIVLRGQAAVILSRKNS